jgi:hypothetical protein
LWHNPETGELKIFGNKGWELAGGGNIQKKEHSGDATILPNVYNVFGTVTGARTITKGEDKPNVVNIYIIRFDAGADCAITFNGWSLKWVDGNVPAFTEGKTYEITIIDNLAMYVEA